MESNKSFSNRVVFNNFFWRFLERFGAQIVSFVVSIILARLLNPTIYGTVALVTVFTSLFNVFIDSGLGSALIQKKDSDDLDFSTVFYFNVFVCVLLYIAIFFLSPLIASFYNNEELVLIIRVMSLILIISGIKNIQVSYVSKTMQYKKFFYATLFGTLISAAFGVGMAFAGYGVWALVAQTLINQLVDTIILWVIVKWRPKRMFSFKELKVLFNFGWKLLVSKLLDTGYKELRALIIGKRYTPEDLSFYNKGENLPSTINTLVGTSVNSVLLPSMSQCQENPDNIKKIARRSISVSSYVLMPMLFGLAACCDSLIPLLLGNQWTSAIFFMKIFCVTYSFYTISAINLNVMEAMGKSNYFLILEIIKKVIGLSVIIGTMFISVKAMAYSLLGTTFLSIFINAFPNKKLINYSFFDQIKDYGPSLLLSFTMFIFVSLINYIPGLNSLLVLLIQVVLGVLFYIGFSILFKFEPLEYIYKFFSKKNKNNLQTIDKSFDIKKPIMVSIICTAYMHEKYISECLDGFLSQLVNFNVEILIHDDASTDKTREIIENYAEKYPDIIHPIYQTENQYSKGISVSEKFLYENVKGKYVAFCEGDDFWTDNLKLFKQVEFLEKNPTYSACVHNVKTFNMKTKKYISNYYHFHKKGDVNFKELLDGFTFQTASIVQKASILKVDPSLKLLNRIGDVPRRFHLFFNGPIYFMKEKMSVYRLYSGANSFTSSGISNYNNFLNFYEKIYTIVDNENKVMVRNRINEMILDRMCVENRYDEIISNKTMRLALKRKKMKFKIKFFIKLILKRLNFKKRENV